MDAEPGDQLITRRPWTFYRKRGRGTRVVEPGTEVTYTRNRWSADEGWKYNLQVTLDGVVWYCWMTVKAMQKHTRPTEGSAAT